jgi:hypothetical protein
MESHLPINPNDALIGLMAQRGFAGAVVDTARKNGGHGYRCDREFVDCARTHGQVAGLARCKGSLSPNYHFAEGQGAGSRLTSAR